MVSLEKEKQKRLKEAKTLYEKSLKAFQKGDISKDELKDRLRPYKYELKELGYPVKIKDDETAPDKNGPDTASTDQGAYRPAETPPAPSGPVVINVAPWSRRSQLTMDEVERRIDTISLSKRPSEALQSRYQSKFGEDLEPPLDLVPYTPSPGTPAQPPQGPDQGGPSKLAPPSDDEGEKRPFWKGLFKGRRRG